MPDEPWKLVASVALCQVAGLAGALFTRPQIDGWYRRLRKPSFTPPDQVFAPVWTALYLLMGVGFYLVWRGHDLGDIAPATTAFLFQLGVNVAWSAVFFGARSPAGGLIVVFVLVGSVLWMMFEFRAVSELAAFLQVPYLLWSSFAALLNFRIFRLNPEG